MRTIAILSAALLVQAAPAHADVAIQPADMLIVCVERHVAPGDMNLLATAMLDQAPEPPVDLGPIVTTLVRRCGNGSAADQTAVMIGFAYVLMGKGRELLAARMSLSGERRTAFEDVLRPFADQLEPAGNGGNFGSAEIPDAVLRQVRQRLATAGFTMEISDYSLRGYMESLARDRTIRAGLVRMLGPHRPTGGDGR